MANRSQNKTPDDLFVYLLIAAVILLGLYVAGVGIGN